jgi:CheY-like chemotaxis protein
MQALSKTAGVPLQTGTTSADHGSDAAKPDRPRPTVLIVDDSRFVRATMVRALGADFLLQQAESGERAWEMLLLDESIRAVLSDLTMPGMDGFELLRRVRESVLPRVAGLPFAVLSGADDPAHRARAAALGADRFVVKGDGFDAMREWLAGRLDPRVRSPAVDGAGGIDVDAADATAGPVLPSVSRVVPDPLQRWFRHQLAGLAPEAGSAVLIRLHAPGSGDLPARLRRGVRAADALHQEGADTAWLFVAAPPPVAVKLAIRFGLLAGGRPAGESGSQARACVTLRPLDRNDPAAALAVLQQTPSTLPPGGRIALDCVAGVWGDGWRFDLPWAAARLLIG